MKNIDYYINIVLSCSIIPSSIILGVTIAAAMHKCYYGGLP